MFFGCDLEAFEICLPASTLLLTKHFNIGVKINVLMTKDDFRSRTSPVIRSGKWKREGGDLSQWHGQEETGGAFLWLRKYPNHSLQEALAPVSSLRPLIKGEQIQSSPPPFPISSDCSRPSKISIVWDVFVVKILWK